MIQAKKMLREIRIIRIGIKALEEKREIIKARATKATRNLNGMPSAANTSDFSSDVVELVELDDLIKDKIAEASRRECEAIEAISCMEHEKYKTLLTLYYIAGDEPCTWEQVAKEMRYSVSVLWHEHGRALLEFQKVLDSKT